MKTLIVLPSYNEAENIVSLIEKLLALSAEYYVCVVDDASPDGTAEKIRVFQEGMADRSRLHLIVREKKDGRGGAVRRGLTWGLQTSKETFTNFVEMDCDFSHQPEAVAIGLRRLRDAEVVLGSRYPDGEIRGWPVKRRVFSFLANLLARVLISWVIVDYTNGFRFYSREAAEHLLQCPQKHKGYIYLSESIVYFLKHGYRIASFPILFINRERGVSNTNFAEIAAALRGIFSIAWNYNFGRNPPRT